MKLTERTIKVLKNFSTINQSIRFQPGETLKTMSPMKTILAEAKLDMKFEKEFCIDDLSRFLSALSLYDDYTLDITPVRVVINGGAHKVSQLKYMCADPEFLVLPPEKEIKFPDALIKFTLTNTDLKSTRKAMDVLGLSEIAIVGKDGDLALQAINSEGKLKDSYSLPIGKTNHEFKIIFKIDNLKLISADYSVAIGQKNGKGIAKFTGIDFPVEYFIAVDSRSEFIKE